MKVGRVGASWHREKKEWCKTHLNQWVENGRADMDAAIIEKREIRKVTKKQNGKILT